MKHNHLFQSQPSGTFVMKLQKEKEPKEEEKLSLKVLPKGVGNDPSGPKSSWTDFFWHRYEYPNRP